MSLRDVAIYDKDVMSKIPREKKKVTTGDIITFLESRFKDKHEYIAVKELRPYTGFGEYADQRIDFWVMNTYPSKRHARHSFEIKTSRSDFLREIKQPNKRRIGLAISNQFWFIAPEGLIKPEEVPIECGLIECFWGAYDATGMTGVTVIAAPHRDTNVLSWGLLASVARRLNKGEEK